MQEPSVVHDTFVIERSFPVAPEKVFSAFADATEVQHHGAGHDDQTILLVRPAEDDEGNDRKKCTPKRPETEVDNPHLRQATWRRLLDELTAELTGE